MTLWWASILFPVRAIYRQGVCGGAVCDRTEGSKLKKTIKKHIIIDQDVQLSHLRKKLESQFGWMTESWTLEQGTASAHPEGWWWSLGNKGMLIQLLKRWFKSQLEAKPAAPTWTSPLLGGTGEVQGLAGIVRQKLVYILAAEASLLTNQQAPQCLHRRLYPLHLQIHQQLLKHKHGFRKQREIVLPGGRRESQQHLEEQTYSCTLNFAESNRVEREVELPITLNANTR